MLSISLFTAHAGPHLQSGTLKNQSQWPGLKPACHSCPPQASPHTRPYLWSGKQRGNGEINKVNTKWSGHVHGSEDTLSLSPSKAWPESGQVTAIGVLWLLVRPGQTASPLGSGEQCWSPNPIKKKKKKKNPHPPSSARAWDAHAPLATTMVASGAAGLSKLCLKPRNEISSLEKFASRQRKR